MTADVVWPAHAYVPGQNTRHTEGAFDGVRATAQAGMSISALSECEAFRVGLAYLDAGFFWEAHELLEPVWMALPETSEERAFVQGVIQLANGLLKVKMHRPKAALRLAKIARDLIPVAARGRVMGMELAKMHEMIDSLEKDMESAL